ncbi:uncharacterized protein LOC143284506 isoform X2 [Babylonia areolata]|uniref:uncharacterized protein LOC143284506 isoform X2 n=1 Tax=Babylonia areolata TaxID=304850 RepID=UPI003FD22BC4
MNGQRSPRGVTTAPARSKSMKNLSSVKPGPAFLRGSSSGLHSPAVHSSGSGGSPSHRSPAQSLTSASCVHLPLHHHHHQQSLLPAASPGQLQSQKSPMLLHSERSPQHSPGGSGGGSFSSSYSSGQSPVGSSRSFQFPSSFAQGAPPEHPSPHPPPPQQRVQVVEPFPRHPEEAESSPAVLRHGGAGRSLSVDGDRRETSPGSAGPSSGEEEGEEEAEDVMEYPHQQVYLGACSAAGSAEEQREKQLKTFVTMQNSSHHKHPGSPEPHIPTPDYDPDTPKAERNSFVFVEKFRDVISHINTIEELYSEVPEPVPDYHEDEDSNDFPPPPPPIVQDDPEPTSPTDTTTTATPTVIGVRNGAVSSPEEEGEQIQPRKLFNPCVVSRERQALHKELLLNYKLGKDVLQKPELNKILAKRKDTQKRKEWEEMQANKRTSLELRLEEQANRLKEKEETDKMKTISEDEKQPEFVQMHRRITHKTPTSPPT